jgi:hypothetical protein
MSKSLTPACEAVRITCMVHQRLSAKASEILKSMGARMVLQEGARCVRQVNAPGIRRFPGKRLVYQDAPMEIFRTTVSANLAAEMLCRLRDALELDVSGRGSVYAQDIVEHSVLSPPESREANQLSRDLTEMHHNLILITGIISRAGGAESLARTALKLGAGVPTLTLGEGTGIRDRLGLLRIAIPPEKELVHLMVPAQDAAGLMRMLIDEGGLDRPGGGFLYQSKILAGIPDTLVRIGAQEHAASMEQIIAAVDDLKRGTGWRRRFAGMELAQEGGSPVRRNHREITFICPEGCSDSFVHAAMNRGAAGATVSKVRCLSFSDQEGGIAARERGVLCIPSSLETSVLEALLAEAERDDEFGTRIQVLDAPAVFSHQKHQELSG